MSGSDPTKLPENPPKLVRQIGIYLQLEKPHERHQKSRDFEWN